ncbi:MAG: hypothetical protein JW915_23660 [Chitinispirillaceae bacterium]|nr:hypothetical protein [Chitinispirillaceae bacterium]
MAVEIYLGPVGNLYLLTPFGRTLSMGDIEISRTDRTASGRKVSDIITTKKKFTIQYSLIDGQNLQLLQDIYNLHSELIIEIENLGTSTEYTVLMSPFDQTRVLSVGAGLWQNVTIELEEV